ncbi:MULTISPECIES: PspA/IM30 family protein [Brevibacillus]|uniref:PspA/IM30 family protein n=1 Tax=Brevibacillus TaxID=55080 RepID=UPI000D10617B|nr:MULTISPECIES: PspA/IM30 family protein [Brevibacillus]MED1946700.1 PspA/IM30 family protein [Brevibacillus formosus]MED1996958.1 PspA/IM30 family protein [Brevibacillus formosus]MED2084875.1 PspA/IM30 family protein [Brevibacillus formosus]PSK21272.1 phage shock protein A [Brevibacillus sp. NRRL NRS-603]
MGIFKRVRDIVVADVHEVLNKVENPITLLDQYIRDMDNQIEKANQALSYQLFLEKRYDLLIAEEEANIEKRAKQASLAVDCNEDNMAKLALQEKVIHENKRNLYQDQYDATKKQTAILYEQIDKLKNTYQEFQFKKLVLTSRAHAAKSIKQGQEMLSGFHSDYAMKGFARVEEFVQKLEAEVAASSYVYGTKAVDRNPHIDHLLAETVEAQLAELKKTKEVK